MRDISHLTIRNRVGALTFKSLALDIDGRAPTLSFISKVGDALIGASYFITQGVSRLSYRSPRSIWP